MPKHRHKRPKTSPTPTDHPDMHPLSKNAWKSMYEAIVILVDVIEKESRCLGDMAADKLMNGFDDGLLEKKALMVSVLLDNASELEDTLYRIMYPELDETPKEGLGKYE